MGSPSDKGPLFPATPEELAERRRMMRELLAVVDQARVEGRRTVPQDAVDKLAAVFPVPVTIRVDWEGTEELSHPMISIQGPRQSAVFIPNSLTPREREVAQLVADGLTNAEIADRLGISVGTVKDHVHHILERTGHRNRNALAAALRKSDAD